MRTLYSIAIAFYALGVRIAALWNRKARQMRAGWRVAKRDETFESLKGSRVAWFHAASLGEFEQARPLMELYRAAHPDWKIALTFFSPSGYEVRKHYEGADLVCYLTPDTRRAARRLVAHLHPDIAFFVKYEFWYNVLDALRRRGTPTYSFSTIFRPGQIFFRRYGGWFVRQLQTYEHIFVQNEASRQLLLGIGMERCTVTGDTRFDRVADIASQAKRYEVVERFVGEGSPVLMAGSSWEPDEANIAAFASHYTQPLKIILAPHVIDEAHLRNIEQRFGAEHCVRYSALSAARATIGDAEPCILIIDNIGMLSSLYRYATIAYIGGGFGRGIHNTLEAAVFGCPVCFGPNHQKFQEALDLIACGGAAGYETAEELEGILSGWLRDREQYEAASQACRHYMATHCGAAKTIMERIERQ